MRHTITDPSLSDTVYFPGSINTTSTTVVKIATIKEKAFNHVHTIHRAANAKP
jgi:hypothetical protein